MILGIEDTSEVEACFVVSCCQVRDADELILAWSQLEADQWGGKPVDLLIMVAIKVFVELSVHIICDLNINDRGLVVLVI